jgi:hypothetical protein
MNSPGACPLPSALEEVIEKVMDEADLSFADGSAAVESELRAHAAALTLPGVAIGILAAFGSTRSSSSGWGPSRH